MFISPAYISNTLYCQFLNQAKNNTYKVLKKVDKLTKTTVSAIHCFNYLHGNFENPTYGASLLPSLKIIENIIITIGVKKNSKISKNTGHKGKEIFEREATPIRQFLNCVNITSVWINRSIAFVTVLNSVSKSLYPGRIKIVEANLPLLKNIQSSALQILLVFNISRMVKDFYLDPEKRNILQALQIFSSTSYVIINLNNLCIASPLLEKLNPLKTLNIQIMSASYALNKLQEMYNEPEKRDLYHSLKVLGSVALFGSLFNTMVAGSVSVGIAFNVVIHVNTVALFLIKSFTPPKELSSQELA